MIRILPIWWRVAKRLKLQSRLTTFLKRFR